ncbi:MAG TPA: MlaD family protein [Candidatus Polarisedimenticolaceae bacterium]|nr:MlaD family protein [Candidatus Polarisedimenticolaceae bacterium]
MPRVGSREATVGTFVALALIVFAAGVLAVGGESRLFSRQATYRAVFPDTDGLLQGSPVKMGGVHIGTVTELKLPTDPGAAGVEVSLSVRRVYASRVRQGSEASLRFLQYLSGEKYVELTPGDPNQPAIPPGDLLPTAPGSRIFEQGEDIADNLNAITISLKQILEPLQRGEGLLGQVIQNPDFGKEGMRKIEVTLSNIEDLTTKMKNGEGTVGRLLTDRPLATRLDDLGNAVKDLSTILDQTVRGEGALGSITKKGGDAELAIADLREAAASMKRTAARLESKDGVVGKLLNDDAYGNQVAARLQETLDHLSSIMKKIDAGQGTLGALITDRTLYDSAEDVIAGVNDSKFARWMLRHYQKKGIETESTTPPAAPAEKPQEPK